MRLTLIEIDVLLGLIGDVDWQGHFESEETEKEQERLFAVAERVQEKLLKRYWELKDRQNSSV